MRAGQGSSQLAGSRCRKWAADLEGRVGHGGLREEGEWVTRGRGALNQAAEAEPQQNGPGALVGAGPGSQGIGDAGLEALPGIAVGDLLHGLRAISASPVPMQSSAAPAWSRWASAPAASGTRTLRCRLMASSRRYLRSAAQPRNQQNARRRQRPRGKACGTRAGAAQFRPAPSRGGRGDEEQLPVANARLLLARAEPQA